MTTMSAGAFPWLAGKGEEGQLGNGGEYSSSDLVAVVGPPSIFAALAAGSKHTCGLTTSGTAHCWGLATDGQLGGGRFSSSDTPAVVSGGLLFDSLVASEFHTCGLTSTGQAYCWGECARDKRMWVF